MPSGLSVIPGAPADIVTKAKVAPGKRRTHRAPNPEVSQFRSLFFHLLSLFPLTVCELGQVLNYKVRVKMPPSEECCEASVVTKYKGCPGWQSSDFHTWSGPAFWGEQVTPLGAAPTCSPALYSPPAPTAVRHPTSPRRPLMPLLCDVDVVVHIKECC